MNIFTNDDYRRIQAWLKANAIKDSDLVQSETTIPDEDILTIVQKVNGIPTNFKINIKDFLNSSLNKIIIKLFTVNAIKVNNSLVVDIDKIIINEEENLTLQAVFDSFNNQLNDVSSASKGWNIEYQAPSIDEPTVRAKYVLKDYKGVPKGDPIKVYKDSAITNVYLGTTEDTCNENTGEVTKKPIQNNNEALSIVYRLDTGKYSLVNIPIGIFIKEAEFDKYRGLGITENGQVFIKLANDVESSNYLHFNASGEISADGIENRILQDLGTIINSVVGDGTMWGQYKKEEGTKDSPTNEASRWGQYKQAEADRNERLNNLENKFEETEQAIIYDVSAHNNNAVFESLSALLNSSDLNTLIPTSIRHGGMTIRFIQGSAQSSDNKYVQYRLMSNVWSTVVDDWQGVDDVPTAGSDNLVKSGGVKKELEPLTGIDNKDIADTLVWIPKRWLTGTNQPNGAEGDYNYGQKTWYTRIDVSNYDVITCNSFVNGAYYSTNEDVLNGINIYGDGTLIKGIRDASGENIINRSDYSQYTKLELVLQDWSSSHDEFIGTNSVIVSKAGSVASREEFKVLEEEVNSNSSKINDINDTITGIDKDLKENIEILNSINETYNITSTKRVVGGNSWIGSTGNPVQIMPTARIWGVLVKPNTKYLIKMSVPTEGPTVRKGYAFYSSNQVSSNTFISGSDDYPGSDININIEVTTPSNCYMIAFSGYSDRDNFEIYRYANINENEFLEVKEEVNSNSSEINDLNDIITGIDNKDIADTLVWKKARWLTGTNQPNGGEGLYITDQKIWYTRIDVSNYDVITCKNFINGISLSTYEDAVDGISIYGDGTLIKGIRNAAGENTINRSDYSEYTKLELVLQAKSTSDNEFIGAYSPSLVVYKAGISQEKPKPKRIVLVGDSLCGNDSGLIIKQFNSLAAFTKYELVTRCMGGENAIGNLTRAGGIGIRVKAEFTIPASGSVNCALESAWIKSTGVYASTPYNGIATTQNIQVVINGIRGKLTKSEINAVGIAFYTSDGTFISGLIDSGTFDIPSNATQYAFTINEPATGMPHITINGDAVEDLASKATRNGYIDNTGTFVSSESFRCSELLPISQGEIYIDSLATSTGYVFTRLKEGEETKIGIGNVFFDASLYDYKDYPHIWFTGQNGGYETEEDWANMVSSAANNFSEKYIVCSTALGRTTNELIYQANKCFGARYLNLRAYTQGQAVYDGQKLGIIDAQYSASDYETLFWPGSDKVHQNNKLSYIWAVKMWNQLLELGYVEGERIETGEYYVP